MSDHEKKRVTCTIFGKQYTIVGTDSEQFIVQVAETADKKMREIHSMNPNLHTEALAVLTAVNAIYDYIKLKEQYDELLEKFHSIKRNELKC